MSILAKIPWLQRKTDTDDDRFRDVAEILEAGRPARRSENLRFTMKTRGKSPANLFGRDQLREAILHCVVTDHERR